ncbi:MAG: hypothetical protein RIR00_1410 [Pseudomonadota bacterium]
MYVCICHAVTESKLREAVALGADSLRALRNELGVASQCGKCARCAHSILKDCQRCPNEGHPPAQPH